MPTDLFWPEPCSHAACSVRDGENHLMLLELSICNPVSVDGIVDMILAL